jgi:hypothetical protein
MSDWTIAAIAFALLFWIEINPDNRVEQLLWMSNLDE